MFTCQRVFFYRSRRMDATGRRALLTTLRGPRSEVGGADPRSLAGPGSAHDPEWSSSYANGAVAPVGALGAALRAEFV